MGKRIRFLIVMVVFGVATLVSSAADAELIKGKVTYIGTKSEHHVPGEGYQAVFRIRVSESTCGSDTTPKTRWVEVRSGRMDGAFVHNAANLKNAYTTVMTAFLTGKTIDVDRVPSCDASKSQIVNLWDAWIGLNK